MRTLATALTAVLALSTWACGATTSSATGTATGVDTVTGASVTFMTRGDGKDEDSAIAVQLLDDSARLSAEGTAVDIEFDDNTVSAPLTLSLTRALTRNDLDDARMRLRLTPDGNDTWNFDVRLTARLSDGTEQQYFWSGLTLNENAPERVLPLRSGRLP